MVYRPKPLLLHESHRREDRQARIDACVEFLATFRKFRTYVLTHDLIVVVQPADDGCDVAFIKDSPEYTDAVQRVIGRLRLLEGGQSPLVDAASEVQEAHRKLVLARTPTPFRWGSARRNEGRARSGATLHPHCPEGTELQCLAAEGLTRDARTLQ